MYVFFFVIFVTTWLSLELDAAFRRI